MAESSEQTGMYLNIPPSTLSNRVCVCVCVCFQGGNGSLSLMATSSFRSLQGEDMLASYEACYDSLQQEPPEEFQVSGPDVPLMPLLLRIHFISNSNGEGIPNLKKLLYRVGEGEVGRWRGGVDGKLGEGWDIGCEVFLFIYLFSSPNSIAHVILARPTVMKIN